VEIYLLFTLLICCAIGFVAVTTLLCDLVGLLDKYLKIQAREAARAEATIKIIRTQQELIESGRDQLARIVKAIYAMRN